MPKGVPKQQRAGNRKCRRCKALFYKEANESLIICPRCRAHCVRCDVELTKQNHTISNKSKRKFYCIPCDKKARDLSLGNDGYNQREYRLLKQFAMTLLEYNEILELQGGVCFICKNPPSGNALAVDHKHVLKDKQQNPRDTRTRVRGLLCWHCNAALGKFKDDPIRLRRAAEYLETWPAQKVLNAKQ